MGGPGSDLKDLGAQDLLLGAFGDVREGCIGVLGSMASLKRLIAMIFFFQKKVETPNPTLRHQFKREREKNRRMKMGRMQNDSTTNGCKNIRYTRPNGVKLDR